MRRARRRRFRPDQPVSGIRCAGDAWRDSTRARALYHDARHVFAMSAYAARSLARDYGLPPGRVTVVGGVNIAVADHQPRPIAATPPTILFIGKEFRRKGGNILLTAFRLVRAALPAARLRLVGTAEARPEPGVEVLGRIGDRARLAACYAEATVFCLPLRYDPFPGVLLEAMVHGVPCVGTAVCGIPEIILDGATGLIVPPADAPALATALLRLLEDPALAARLGAAGRRRTEQRLNWDRVVARMAPALGGLPGDERGEGRD